MPKKIIPVQTARKEHFAGMANANFYRYILRPGFLKTFCIGRNRYTTEEWIDECITKLTEENIGPDEWERLRTEDDWKPDDEEND